MTDRCLKSITFQQLPLMMVNIVERREAKMFEKQECIPVGCVPPTAVAVLGVLHTNPPGSRPPRTRYPPPPGVGLVTPSGQFPLNFALGCGPGDPPGQIPLNFPPLGVSLKTCKACWDTPQDPMQVCTDTTCNACWDTTTPPFLWTE